MERKNFFSRENIHTAIWGASLSLIAFFSGKFYDSYSEPAVIKVETKNEESALNVKIVENKVKDNGISKEDIEKLTLAINDFNKSTKNSEANSAIKLLSYEIRNFNNSLEKNRVASDFEKYPADSAEDKLQINDDFKNQEAPKNNVLLDEIVFNLPKEAKGHTPTKIRGVKKTYCPPAEVFAGVPISIGFTLTDKAILDYASPLIFSISRIDGPRELYQIFERNTILKFGLNNYTYQYESKKLNPGKYSVTYGYFRKDKLDGEYPLFYVLSCEMSIVTPSKI